MCPHSCDQQYCSNWRKLLIRGLIESFLQNEGGSYNVTSGIFTCTVSGLYQFAFNFLSNSDDHSPHCNFYHNNSHLLSAFAKGFYNSGTMVMYLNLSIGETIGVRCSDWNYIDHSGYYICGLQALLFERS